jgi:hypothetical protein
VDQSDAFKAANAIPKFISIGDGHSDHNPRGDDREAVALFFLDMSRWRSLSVIHYSCAPMQEGLAFLWKGSIGVAGRQRAEGANATAPSALTDLGLALVRPGLTGPLGREKGLAHECQTYRCASCDDERCGTTEGPLLVGAGKD